MNSGSVNVNNNPPPSLQRVVSVASTLKKIFQKDDSNRNAPSTQTDGGKEIYTVYIYQLCWNVFN